MTDYATVIARLNDALERAKASGRRNMNAMILATADANGRPSSRSVLLKSLDEQGLIFFTDERSEKARDLAENPYASACFYWEPIEEQARIDGRVERLDRADVAADFAARPRAGQLLISASRQSQRLDRLETLRNAVAECDQKLPDPVPCPPTWIGFRIVPERIEHWQGSRDRMHTRTLFNVSDGKWSEELLYP